MTSSKVFANMDCVMLRYSRVTALQLVIVLLRVKSFPARAPPQLQQCKALSFESAPVMRKGGLPCEISHVHPQFVGAVASDVSKICQT